ncbi:MAG: hypothetical protein QGG40_05850, partial [Myxococcota bacterium]|nr:hypothetical protein [Myxococcota bacterium]
MLKWTTGGAVQHPSTVQIRVQRSYPGRIRAGAPVPTRSMSPEEVIANIRHFTVGMRTPRTTPCTGLVLSGVGVATREDTPGAISLARTEKVERIILHAGIEDLESLDTSRFAPLVDLLVLPVQPGSLTVAARTLEAARSAGVAVATSTVLHLNALDQLTSAARLLARAQPRHVTFTYPFPVSGNAAHEVPLPPRVMAALRPALDILDAAGMPATIKGLPACHLGP